MAKSSFEAANFFNIVQKLYTFFASSTFRWAILLKYIDSYTLKPLSDTRWESRVDSLKALRFQIGPIYDALYSIYEDPEIDNMIRDEASGLLNNLKQFKFICSIVIWYKILSRINPISKLLQTVHFDISQAIDTLNNCKLFFENLRSDEAFESIILEATELASEVDVEANFEATTPRHRIRNKTRNVLYEGPDEPVQDLKQKYKIELFFHTVDQAINALKTRYNLLNTHSNYFSFLYNIFGLKDMRRNELLAYCKDLEVVLTKSSQWIGNDSYRTPN
ncbi:hypothetical protein RN001_002108 [Aquatica leii]|uniref:Uncharacterized protein n=1 Tax=Aquatica leii TaxID=1421715 RepID=A0AAN7PGN7_9COLE|nr:hypothetical protein RN001_002108 [Aquatica leii]